MEASSVPILMYHSISTSTNPLFTQWAVSPELFDQHLAYLKAHQYNPITVTDLVKARTRGEALPTQPVVLTFDDAYADFYENAFPTLQRYGFVASLYIPTAYVGGTCDWLKTEGELALPMATWSQLAEVCAGGVECGGHSHNHVQMDAIPTANARMEITRCKAILEERLGHEIVSFAYPHGWTTGAVKRMVQEAGFTSACAVKNMRSVSTDDPFELARLVVTGDTDVDALERLLARQPGPIEVKLRDIARPVWRFVPRSRARLTRYEPDEGVQPQAEEFEPAAMLDVEISQPVPDVAPVAPETGRSYQRALALIRLHTQPLGLIELSLGEGGLSASQLARRVWEELGPQITAHLAEDGLDPVSALGPEGLSLMDAQPCLEARQAFLANAPFVSVAIPTHNRSEQVVALVHSVLASDYPPERFEVIVVDNAPSTDETARLIEQTFGDVPQVRYVREDRPGSSNARNRGLEMANGEIVVFADDDELVDRHWLAETVRGFDVSDDVACVTGLIAPMESETPAQGLFEQFGGYCKGGFSRRLFNLTTHRAESPLYPYNVGVFGSGGSMAYKRSVLMAVGKFDQALGPATPTTGGEDIDAMLRIVLEGHTLLYQPTAIARHPSYREYAQLRGQLRGYGIGLASCLFKTLVTRPGRLPDFIGKLPRGLFYAFSSHSPRHAAKRSDYPKELTRLEFMGLLYGPLAYLRSRYHLARSVSLGGSSAQPAPQANSLGEAR